MVDKILIPMGLSTQIWAVIPYVRHLAVKFGSELHLLGLSTEPQQIWDNSLMKYVESISNSLRDENIATRTNFVYGNPAVEVVKYSDKNGIGLVATLAGSCNEITCNILGNIAKRMRITLNLPVLMVPPFLSKDTRTLEKAAFLKILVPLDGSQIGESILPYIEAIALSGNSSVTLLHVNSPPFRGVPIMHNDVTRISRAAGREYVKKVCGRLQGQGIEANFEVIDGVPVKTILKYADQQKVDLIAMGTRGSTGIDSWIFGSVTNRVSEKSTVPILTISHPAPGSLAIPSLEYA
jgi:nucleotide-binding universal stress UspA family protein